MLRTIGFPELFIILLIWAVPLAAGVAVIISICESAAPPSASAPRWND